MMLTAREWQALGLTALIGWLLLNVLVRNLPAILEVMK
jgi:hypothetical protein